MKKTSLIVTCMVVIYQLASAQSPSFNKGINFKTDNDSYLFFGQDQYYTSGMFFSFQNALKTKDSNTALAKKIWELSFGQKMYNSYSGNVPKADKQDRPFAAYLYGSAGFSWLLKNETSFKTSLALGIVGESAKGKESQEFIHDVIGFYEVNGWEHQIRDIFSIVGEVEVQKLLVRNNANSVDLSAEVDAQFGNTFNNLGVGLNVRLGNMNQLFQSAYTNSVVANGATPEKLHKRESYFFVNPKVHVVGTDATIQGGSNKISPVTFGVKRFVYSQVFGYTYSTPRFTFDYRVQLNTKELKSKADQHEFGSFTLQYRFN